MRSSSLLACLAILNFATSPLLAETTSEEDKVLIAKLCGGGEIRIPIGQSKEEQDPHCPDGKACHAGSCRKQFDPGQRLSNGTD